MTSISLSTAYSSHSRSTRPFASRRRRAPVEVAHDLVRVEAVGGVVDRDPAAEVRVAAVVARVALHACIAGGMPAGLRGMQQRAAGAEQRETAGDQATTS